jgi:TRAP-type C4-dicarboxylate transport system permease small subunit
VSVLERLSVSCNRSIERALLGLGLTMTGIVILQVFYRYALNHSLFWSEELARYLLVWLTFLGATVAYRRHMHPSVDIFFKRLARPARRRLKMLVHLLSLLFFFILIWYGTTFSYFVRLQTTPALALPKWLIFAIIPLSGIIFTLHALAFLSGELNPPPHDRVKP